MADIFISYSREDQVIAGLLAEGFRRSGWTVWWDRYLHAGAIWEDTIRENLTIAKCVVVIWSNASLSPDRLWVRAEATEGLERNCLIPVSIGLSKPPLPFNQIQTTDLTGWTGDPAYPAYQALLHGIERHLGVIHLPAVAIPNQSTRKRFSVAVAQIDQDSANETQNVIVMDLVHFEGIEIIRLNKPIVIEGADLRAGMEVAESIARQYLKDLGATLMIWGTVVRFNGEAVPQLYLTTVGGKDLHEGRYAPIDGLYLPRIFWSDLVNVLRLVVLTYDADFQRQEGLFLSEQLKPFIDRVRALLAYADPKRGWNDTAKCVTRISLATALMLVGIESGENEPLEEAIQHYRQAIVDSSREASPRSWSSAQNGLGINLCLLGRRLGNIELLAASVDALSLALMERGRENHPLAWAQSQSDLGNALLAIGQMHGGTAWFERAITAYRAALLERTRESAPIDWAQTTNNLGVALWELGKQETHTKHLQEAAAALQQVFHVYTREKTPLDWSQAKNNLGLVLWSLGERKIDVVCLHEALRAFRDALRERRVDRAPLLWAETQNNRGLALWTLGDVTQRQRHLQHASKAFRSALLHRTRDAAPREWAQTQNNLGAVLYSLAVRNPTIATHELKEASLLFTGAINFYTAVRATRECAPVRRNLANALALLGTSANCPGDLVLAVEQARLALEAYDQDKEPMLWGSTQGDLGKCLLALGTFNRDRSRVNEARESFVATRAIFAASGMKSYAEAFDRQIVITQQILESWDSEVRESHEPVSAKSVK